ncbi:MAG TPA: N-acetylglucosamine-6-phosphate deacetylase [Pirellulaceae bacterium]|nr:N-acetylglucosamine-6-phosphate deacetylase [Pirellulaceae bacterium]
MSAALEFRGNVILPDRVLEGGAVRAQAGRIVAVGPADGPGSPDNVIDAGDGYIAPGFVDLHVHGGAGADFMDGTEEAFLTALACHARHGTTSLAATTTVARHEQIMAVLEVARQLRKREGAPGSRVMGVHFYGPYFRKEAKGAHPGAAIRPPVAEEYLQYLEYADSLVTCTVAPELPGAKDFALACRQRGVRTNVGHSWATFDQMAQAVEWGVRHVDHLFCAMSDKTRLRQFQMYPMQGGVLEATLFFDELTTEVIADGKHLSHDLLKLALKIKGPDRLALVTDCSRALDMPDGEYLIGPLDGGEPIIKLDGVGMLPDMKALGSSIRGMDFMVRTFLELTGRPLWEVVRMATLTPARIAGWEREIGSLETGKRADVLVLSRDLEAQRVFRDGVEITDRPSTR